MQNSNIIDFFSRKSYKDIITQDYQSNDELTNKYGVYLGCLRKQDSNIIRSLTDKLEFKREQIEQLTAEWERLYNEKEALLRFCLNYLDRRKAKNINLDQDTIMVSEEGHTWVIYDYENIKK